MRCRTLEGEGLQIAAQHVFIGQPFARFPLTAYDPAPASPQPLHGFHHIGHLELETARFAWERREAAGDVFRLLDVAEPQRATSGAI